MKILNTILVVLSSIATITPFITEYLFNINMSNTLTTVWISFSTTSIILYIYRIILFKPLIFKVMDIMNQRFEILENLQKEEKLILERKLEYLTKMLIKHNITDSTGTLLRNENEVQKHIEVLKPKYEKVNKDISYINKLNGWW